MTDWFRSWHGAPTDPKWIVVARKAETIPAMVAAVVWALFDHASQQEDRGDIRGFDVETYSAVSGMEEDVVDRIIAALADKGIIADNRLSSWEKRQPKREDNSAPRVALHRERNAEQRTVTQGNAPEESREEKKKKERKTLGASNAPTDSFEELWKTYPKREGSNPKKPARLAFERAVKRGGAPEAIILAAKALAQKHPTPTQFVPQMLTWLNQDRWSEQESTGPPEVGRMATVEDIFAERGLVYERADKAA